MRFESVPGADRGSVKLYALSTCGWCRKTKDLLNSLGVAYSYVFVDLLPDEEREDAVREIEHWNPNCSFPTMVVKDETCIVGYKPDEIKKAVAP